MAWEIKGESGKALNATLRTTDSLNIDVHTLQLQTLADDSYVWTAATNDATGAGTIVPTVGQVVEVFVDGVRRFRGHAMKPQVGLTSVRVEVLGPWYWLNVVDLTGEIEDAEGDSGERTSFVFPTQGLRTSIISLIERMIDKGVPIALGDIDIMYTCPKMTLSNMSFASALAELMRWAPHCVAWFDYTGASGGMPILNVTRRDNLVGTTFTVGTSLLEDVRIQPRLDLQVTETRLKYVTRNPTTGKPKWASQSAGTGGAGSRQIAYQRP